MGALSTAQAETQLSNTHQSAPWNAETTIDRLLDYEITPYQLLYARNHCKTLPEIDPEHYEIHITGLVAKETVIAFTDLLRLEEVEFEVAMQCAGLRRDEMNEIRETEGVAWSSCAVSNCVYSGVLLSTVLSHLGVEVEREAKYVQFASSFEECKDDSFYGSSIPADLIDTNDVLLAYRLNGRDLPRSHGGPCRLVIPGVYGARSVKWVDTITFSTEESACFYQQRDYKVLPEHIQSQEQATEEDVWSKSEAMTKVVPESVITRVRDGNLFRGYALSGAVIDKVEVSFDDKQSWQQANIVYQSGKWSWTLFEVEAPETLDCKVVYSRATDRQGNVQPEHAPWNLRGVGYNSYGAYKI